MLFRSNWREVMQARSTVEAPNLRRCLETVPWWKLAPDVKHEFLIAGIGEWPQADYAVAAVASDGSCGIVYLPAPRAITVALSKFRSPVSVRWFDPTSGQFKSVEGSPFSTLDKREFTPPARNAAGESDWVLVLKGG